MANPPVGVVVMAYGTPKAPSEIEAYYTHIRRGNAPTPEQLADLTKRYEAIGGVSPLAERTEAQRRGIEAALEEQAPGATRVILGQKHAAPFIEDAVTSLADAGINHVVGLVLAPHYSGFSVGQYQQRLRDAAAEHGMTTSHIDRWHLEESYVSFLTGAVQDALIAMPAKTTVVFTAHSLPERVLVDDPYPEELSESAAAVADALGLASRAGWSLGWQSAGRTPEPWRGPDILDIIRDLATHDEVDGVLVCPQGFVSDHLEVVYDLDIEAQKLADDLGLAFARTEVLNDHGPVLAALATLVLNAIP